MSTAEDRKTIFRETLDSLSLSQGGLAKWMSQEDSKQTRESVSRKYRGASGITKTDIALIQLLKKLEDDGYDLQSVEFSGNGVMDWGT